VYKRQARPGLDRQSDHANGVELCRLAQCEFAAADLVQWFALGGSGGRCLPKRCPLAALFALAGLWIYPKEYGMKSLQRATGLIGLILMAAFLLPYIFKLPQLDITLILMGGLGLAVFDYFSSNKND
jgi:hypothetical protein